MCLHVRLVLLVQHKHVVVVVQVEAASSRLLLQTQANLVKKDVPCLPLPSVHLCFF